MPSVDVLGRLPDGREVRGVTLRAGTARLLVLDLGAAVDAWVPAGATRSVVVGLDGDVARRWAHRDVYAGVVGGRFLSRIRDGRLELDGHVHRLATNDHGHTLHGGPDGFDARTWTLEQAEDEVVVLSLVSPDGDQGFPGTLRAEVTYRLEPDAVHVDVVASSDAPTVVNLGAHPYLDVGRDPSLTVPASRWIPVDDEAVALPGSEPVTGTDRDAREPLPVGPGSGFDFSYLVDGSGRRLLARLEGPDAAVEVVGDTPALQVFTGGALGGIALEAQGEPGGPHRGDPTCVLRPGGTWSSSVTWRHEARGG